MKNATAKQALEPRRAAPQRLLSDLGNDAARDIGAAMNAILADVFALDLKTKNFFEWVATLVSRQRGAPQAQRHQCVVASFEARLTARRWAWSARCARTAA